MLLVFVTIKHPFRGWVVTRLSRPGWPHAAQGPKFKIPLSFVPPADRILYVQSFIDLSIAVSEPEGIENVDIIRSIASGA